MPRLGARTAANAGPMHAFVEMYARVVLEGVGVPVALVDEAYTTQMARIKVTEARPRALRRDARRRKEAVDALAAAEILQHALDVLAEHVDE